MKYFLILSFFVGLPILFAAEPPQNITGVQKQIERQTVAWKVATVKPLSETVKAAFAKNGWRIVLQRPLESRQKQRLTNIVKKGDSRNTAELVFIAGNPELKENRAKLTWLREPGELSTTVVYLGKKWNYDVFLRADIATIAAIKSLLNAEGGDDLYPIYAAALNVLDFNETSRKAAVQLLPQGGKRVIPFVNKSIGNAIANDIDTSPHFVVLKRIGTPEVTSSFLSAYRSKIPNVMNSVEAALLIPPALPGGEQLYLSMLHQRKWIDRVSSALEELGAKKKALAMLNYLKREPQSFEQYMTIVFSEYRCRTGKKAIPEYQQMEKIRLLLARVGDIPGTPKFISMTDKKKNLEAEKMVEERKRLEPLEQEFVKSQNVENAICSALMLCLFQPTVETFNQDYVKRVNAEGVRLLKMLPRRTVRTVLRLLRDEVEDSQESEFFRNLMIQVGL